MTTPIHDPQTRRPRYTADEIGMALLRALRRHRGLEEAAMDAPIGAEEVSTLEAFTGFAQSGRRCRVTGAYMGVDWKDFAELGLLRLSRIVGPRRLEFEAMDRALIAHGVEP